MTKPASRPLPAASPSARRLTGEAHDRAVQQQRVRWAKLAETFAPRELSRLAQQRMLQADLTPADADSDHWLAAAQSVYNDRASRMNRAYNGRGAA